MKNSKSQKNHSPYSSTHATEAIGESDIRNEKKTEKIACFTSFTFSYLSKARLLVWSLKRFHPDWHFVALITDKAPNEIDFSIENELFDEIIWSENLPIENIKSFLFMHDIVEICTAVKGCTIELLAKSSYDKVIYLDPDIAVFNTLQPIIDLLDNYNIILTPHQLTPESSDMAIIDNEISSLKHGVYNLGFVAIRSEGDGLKFAHWWSERLKKYCYDDIPNGLFTDQRWCDHVPVFFDGVHILKDPGYNVASWNLSNRTASIDKEGNIFINEKLLRFYHVTKFGVVGEMMTARYALDNILIYEIWAWYRRKLKEFSVPNLPNHWWYYGQFNDGVTITKEHRNLYKKREDLQNEYLDPFHVDDNCYLNWYKENLSI